MLKKRLLSALIIVPSVSAAILWMPSGGMLVVAMVISLILLYEFYGMLEKVGIPSFKYLGVICGSAVLVATYAGLGVGVPAYDTGNVGRAAQCELFVLAISMIAVIVRQLLQKNNDKPLTTIATTVLGIFYIPVLMNFFTKLALTWERLPWQTPMLGHTGCYVIFYIVLVTKFTDAGAYFTGKSLGKHKLIPRVSPGKTWEGCAGGLLTGLAISCLFIFLTHGKLGAVTVTMPQAIILGPIFSLAGMLGDLAESLLKRSANIKDSGAIFPGMGGLLDIFDSLLFAVPVGYICLRLLPFVS